ncbi:tenascin-X isoform X2 [Hemicordylus capensis]|uniref:tenascin-X isoform X2 n=1 Tax=Hemicordylus capensis TaxID=884348 RepID=UPI002303F27E|nr:tenascin-X isoform X2 [Hemicordylus capensis]
MGKPPKAILFPLFIFLLGASWGAHVPHPPIPSNATVFSHVYTIKLAGDGKEGEDVSLAPQEALGPPGSSRGGGLYEHTLEGPDQEHVVFTHRINLPPQACGCSPGTEDIQELLRRLQALENEVRTLRDTCQAGGGCCPAASSTQASTGQTDIRTLCSHHGSFDLSRCLCECEPGWSGPTCAEQACPGGCGGAQRGKCLNGRCQCRPGYSGARCEEPPSCPDDCNDQGRCVDGRCSCFPGYVGPSCADPACPQGCRGHGQCVSGRCVCDPGYSGLDCGTRACPSNCNQRGECRNGRCVCQQGYSGPDCGTQTCPSNCNRRGECRDGRCICEQGYSGPDCGNRKCPSDCNQHGECRNGRCVCQQGYSGPDCGTQTCPSNCNRRGECRDGRCICEQGYSGPDCGTRTCPSDCNQRGECRNGRCVCQQGYSGPDCGTQTCPSNCNRRGECRDGRCICEQGYSGPDCGTRTCPSDCNQRGECRNGRCVCQQGYSGLDCGTQTCPSNCNRRGECRDGRCVCEPGFTGPACGTKSCPNDCSQRGRCLKGGVCACHKGYTGPDCGQLACPEDCSGHGECQNGVCQCHDGYSGDDCSIEIPSIGVRVSRRDETSFRLEWNRPETSVDGYEIHVVPVEDQDAGVSVRLPGAETAFERTGLEPGKEYTVTIRAEKGQRYGPPVSQTVHTRIAPPRGLKLSSATENTLNLHWDPPTTRPDGYILNYVPLVPTRPTQESKRLELPAEPESVTLEDLESRTRYRITLVAHQGGENSRATNIVTSTTAPAPRQPIRLYTTMSPSSRPYPVTSDSGPGTRKPGARPPTDHNPPDTPSVSDPFMSHMVQNISAKLSVFSGTFLERLESYLRTIKFRDDNSIPSVAKAIYFYLMQRKPKEFQELDQLFKKREFFIGDTDSAFSEGYPRPDHTKPTVLASFPGGIKVSLDGVKRHSDYVVIRYHNTRSGEEGELVVPGDTSTAVITGLDPGTTYKLEIHGVVKGVSSKSYSFLTSTAPGSPAPAPDKIRTTPGPTPTPRMPLRDLTAADVSPNSFRVIWSAPPNSFRSFSLQYRDPKSSEPPREVRVPGSERSVNVMGLNPSTEYELQLHGEKPSGNYSAPLTAKISTAPEVEREKPSLGELLVSEVTDSSARLSWDVPTGNFDSFAIQYKDAEGKPQSVSVEGGSREATVSNLVPSRKYKFNLYGLIGRKRVGPVSKEMVTAREPKTEPTLGELSASDVTHDSVRLTWSVPSGSFDSFLVQYKDAEGKLQVLPMEGVSREVTIPSLTPSRRYRFNLYGIANRKRHGPVTTDVITAARGEVPVLSPEPVLGDLSVSDTTSNSVRLLWSVPTGSFDSFLLQYQDSEGNGQTLPVDRDSREVTVPDLVPSQRYRFNLYGISGPQQLGPVSVDAVTAASREPRPDDGRVPPPSLGKLLVSDITNDSVRLSWTVRTGSFDSFLVQFKDSEGKLQARPVDGRSREATIPNLTPSRRYKFNLYGVSARKRFGPISADATTASHLQEPPAPVPPSLGELSVSDITSDAVRLSWTLRTGSFDTFLVQYKNAEGKPQTLPVEGVFREVIVPGLTPSRRYKFNLYGVSNRKRFGPISADATTATPVEVTTERITIQHSLDQLSVSDVTSNSARLSWIVPTGNFDSFEVQYKDTEGKPQVLPVDGASRTITVPNLVPSWRYKFSLYGVSDGQRLGPLSVEAVTAPASPGDREILTPQPRLGELSAFDVTSHSLRLTWSVPNGSFDSFLIQYKDAESRPHTLPVDGGSREVTVSNLMPSRRYKFNLLGISGRKRIGPVSTEALTAPQPTTPPPQPTLGELSVSNITSNSVLLSWTVLTGDFDSFLIQYKDVEGKLQALPMDGGSRQVTVPSLAPSRRYKFNLYGVSGRKRLGPVSIDTVTVSPTVEPPSLGKLSASDITSNSVRLLWNVLTGNFDSFLVQYKDAEGKPQALPVDGALREVTVPNLVPARRYKFNLYGVTGRKRLGPVSTDAVTASDTPPTLGELSVSDVTSDSVHLSWTVPTGNFDSFSVQYKDAKGKLQTLPLDGSTRETTVSGLTPSRRYKFNLYGLSGRKRVGPISADSITEKQKEEQREEPDEDTHVPSLGELSVAEATSDSVRLSWSVPKGNFDSFLVRYKDGDNEPQTLPIDGGAREVTITYLVPSRRYHFDLYGIFEGEHLGPVSTDASTAPEQEGRTTPSPQPDLGELSVSDVTSNSVRLFWFVPVGIFDSFLVQYKDVDGKPQAQPVDKETNSVVIYYLVPSYKYKFHLYGISGRRRFGPISVSTVTATAEPTKEPGEEAITPRPDPRLGELSVSEVTSNSARLSWSVPVGSFDSFSVQYKDAEGRPQALPIEGGYREVIVPNLAPSHKYRFNLYGIFGQQRLGPIYASAITAAAEAPANEEPRLGELSVSEVTSNAARLSWSVPVGRFDSFSVQYKDAEGRPQALPIEGGSREAIVPNLTPSHKYRFNLYGISGNRRFGPISANTVTAAESPKPEGIEGTIIQPRLGDLTVSEVTPDSLLLSWSIQEGSFDSFLIQYKDAVGKLQVLPVDGGMRSLHLYNLTPSQRYKFHIYGVSSHKRFGPMSTDAVTGQQRFLAPETSPEEPTIPPRLGDLSVSKATSDSVSLSWSVPAGSFDSFLIQYKDTEGQPQVLPLDGNSRDVTVPSLAPSHRYKFNLYGIYGQKRLGPISTDAVTGPGTPPGSKTPLRLGELSAHDITPESVLLSWTVETGNFDSFIIQYRDSDGKPHALPVDGVLRSLRLHDLAPSHRYRFNLYGASGRKRVGPITTEAVTAPGGTATPRPTLGELSASDVTGTSAHLSWSVQTGDFDSFIVQYRDAEGKPQALPMNGSSRDVVISNLVPSRKYRFNLYGISGRKRFGPVSTETVTGRIEIQPKLGNLSISEVISDSVRLSWTISAGKFDSFLIRYKDAEGSPKTLPLNADSRTVVITDLMPSYRYKFSLFGKSEGKQIGPISTDAVTASLEAISIPTTLLNHLVVSEVTPTSLKLTWEAPKREFDSFLVQYKDSLLGSGQVPVPAKDINVPGNEHSTVLRGLTPNREYSLTVYGIRNGSQVASLNTAARTGGLELDSPRDLRFSDIRETSVVANWRPPSSRIDRYKVSFQPSDGGEPKSINVDGSKLKTIIEGLTPGASYEVIVMSLRGFEESEPLVGYVTTVPDGPSDLRAVNVTDSSAVLTWQPAMAEMNNYIVTYEPAGGARVSESVPGNRAQLRLSGLRLDTEYRASVYGEREGNRSSPVSATFTTGVDGPRDLRASEISARSAHLTWLPPRAPPGGYLLSYETPYGQAKEIPLDASVTSYQLQDLIPSSRYQVQVQALRRGTPTAPISTSFSTGHLTYPFPRDCAEESMNGPGSSRVTTIYLGGNQGRPLQVYCDMETDDGGWMVFQRRMNGETDFWRDWQDYATGFGNLTREFWLGNDALHQLTTSGDYELRVDLHAGNESAYAKYQHFLVDSPADYYRLHLGSYSGTAGDAFSYHSGSVFSTRDRDPNRVIIPCAVSYRGAWWYRNCHYTNLNGLYANNRDHQGINWFNWKGFEFSIPFTEMKLRPRGFRPLRRRA